LDYQTGRSIRFLKGEKAMTSSGSVLWTATLMVGMSLASKGSSEFLKASPKQINAGTVPEGKGVEVGATERNISDWQACCCGK
jgi:hypothetical protein